MNFVSRNKPEQDGLGDSGVRSVEAALRILEMLAECIGPARVTDIAQQLSLGKPRVCRHLATLEAMGLARKVGRQGYVFGDRLTHMAHHVLRERTVGEIARPALEALRDETGQTVTWSVPAEEGAVVLHCFESEQATTINVKAGTILRYPHSPAARLAKAFSKEIACGADEGPAQAARQRYEACGVDYEIDTQRTGLGGIAAPVLSGSQVLGMVSLVMSSRLLMPRPPLRLSGALRKCVEAIQHSVSQQSVLGSVRF